MKHFIEIPVDGDVHFVNVNQIVCVRKNADGFGIIHTVNSTFTCDLSYEKVMSLIMGV